MNDDQLRDRIARTDPALHGAPTHPVTSQQARALLEDVMNTPLTLDPPTHGDRPAARRPMWRIVGVAAAVVAAIAVGIAVTNGDGGDDPEVATEVTVADSAAPTAPPSVLELSAPGDDIMASCLALDATILSGTELAFKGTVTAAQDGVVELTVDEAYKGTDADVARLSAPEGMQALIGGVDWQVGQQYLVSAYDGVVSYCGQTGPASPELQAIYDQAFAA